MVNTTVSSATQIAHDLTGEITEQELVKGMTLVRMILHLTFAMTAAGAGGVIVLGVSLVERDAAAAGAFPDPATMGDQPGWLLRDQVSVFSSSTNDRSQVVDYFRDLKGKRTFAGEDITLNLIFDPGTLTSAVNVDGLARLLIMRPA